MIEAVRLVEAFAAMGPVAALRVLGQFAVEPPSECGFNGWLWRLPDDSKVVMSDGTLKAHPSLRVAP